MAHALLSSRAMNRTASLLGVLSLGATIACGGTTSSIPAADAPLDAGAREAAPDDATPSDRSSSDASPLDADATGDASDGGGDLFATDTRQIVVTARGGFSPHAPDGSVCSIEDSTYTLALPGNGLS